VPPEHVQRRLREEPGNFRQQYQALSKKHLPNTLLQGRDIFEAFNCPDAWYFMIKLGSMLKQGLNEFDDLFGQK